MPRFAPFHLHWPHFAFDHTKNIRLLYGIRVAKDLIFRISFFFLPVFLFQQGPSIDLLQRLPLTGLQISIVTVGGYYMIIRLVSLLITIPQAQLVARMGIRRSLVMGLSLNALATGFLVLAPTYDIFILISAITMGVMIHFFWPIYFTVLTQNAYRNHLGQDMSLVTFLIQFIAMISPAISGILIVNFGFNSIFLIGGLFALAGIGMAMELEEDKPLRAPSWGEFMSWLQEKEYRQLAVAFAGRSWQDAALTVWPLYIFILLGGIDQVGYLYSLSLLIAMGITFLIGIYLDHNQSRKPFMASGGVLSLLWLLRSAVVNPITIAVVDAVYNMTGNFHWLFFDALDVKRGQGPMAFSYFVYRELIISVAVIIFWLLFIGLFIAFGSWKFLFMLGATAVLLSLQIHDKKHP